MLKINDEVTYKGILGKIRDIKIVRTPKFLNDITLFKVEFEEGDKEWINEIYLTKVI
jgi:hypothetical protein